MRVKIFVLGQEPKIAEYDCECFYSDDVLFEGVSEFVDMSADDEKSFYSTDFKALFEKYRDVRMVNLDYEISTVNQILEC